MEEKTGAIDYSGMTREQLIELIRERDQTMQKLSKGPSRTAFSGLVKKFRLPITSEGDYTEQLDGAMYEIANAMDDSLNGGAIKISQRLFIKFWKFSVGGEIVHTEGHFGSGPEIVTHSSQVDAAIVDTANIICKRIDKWCGEGSGLVVGKILEHELSIYRYSPTPSHDHRIGSSYIPLPKELRGPRKGLVNMHNGKDNKCFLWSHVRHLRPEVHGGRISKADREYAETLNYEGIEFPVKIKQIPKIEKANNIRINVFGYENGRFLPYYQSKAVTDDTMNLLLITDDNVNSHYVLIKDLNRAFYKMTKHKGKKHFCINCIQSFSSKEVLERHREDCLAINGIQSVSYPPEGTKIKFKAVSKQVMAPFIIYADFESIHDKPEPGTEFRGIRTTKLTVHNCCGYAYKLVCSYDSAFSKPVKCYRGHEAANKFLVDIIAEDKWCHQILRKNFNEDIKMTNEDKELFRSQTVCHICKKQISGKKVADHCHFSGKFRGAAHNKCNLSYRMSDRIPVVFHNLRGYDGHFLVPEFGNFVRKPDIIPNNMESYKAIFWKKVSFIDSFQFMSSGLSTLAENLPSDSFTITDMEFREVYEDRAEELLKLIKRKGVYPYDYFDSFERFNEKRLPSKAEFYNNLTEEYISDEDYKHAKTIWKEFEMKTLGDYHDLYLTTEVLLLADVFEKFRKTCLRNYELDPAHYVSAPSLSWDAMLKYTGIELELISDPDIYQMVEKGMRGGVSFVSTRKAFANNEFCENYDPSKPKSWIIYLDANNLYGHAMSQPLPYGGIRFLEEDEVDMFNLNDTPEGKGYILEVDLSYPKEIHHLMRFYPVAPEKSAVTNDMLSPFQKLIGDGKRDKNERLMATLLTKRKYVVHYQNLRYYLSLGVRLGNVHRSKNKNR